MQLSCLLALLGASRIAWAAPVANNNQVESASGDLEERFFYTNYDLEKRDEELDKRFFYTNYDLEKRDEELDKRFFYTNYGLEKRDDYQYFGRSSAIRALVEHMPLAQAPTVVH
ncbi:hypothetical protein KXX33_000961 [Aspergillus fumigatus]|nr:hypothetical protein KXX30_000827 [Aspergillus fumigatus]KAH1286481.1 hypothetical protein KXX48_000448 [Aspergillus fumigatus]KAH1349644.1 hypothetical protein KXX33_000961 [Aspergillus fumigatus]KAH1364096.1 hypothetical protein KXX63_005233 [Aspergillus fumigatus]KAH1377619.1 hypothetical protein KXX50_009084 [Aspergillus fumigatus]